jgi:D-glycero-alpha-D-manno-heptose 1-phosphate guanylyltransferase
LQLIANTGIFTGALYILNPRMINLAMIAIVLVGGKQSLLGDYSDLPSALIPVAGEPFLYWLTQWLKTQGFSHIVYSAGHHADKITAWAHHFASIDPSLCLDVVTETRPLGTAGATALCANRYPSTFTFMVNGDSILLTDVRPYIKQLQQETSLDGIIFGTSVTNAGRFGTLEVNANNRLHAFREKKAGAGPINAGVYLLRNELLAEVITGKETSLEVECFPNWLKQGKNIQVVDDAAPFIDIGTPESLKRAQELINEYQSIITGQRDPMVA